jgi:hypothetical protein
LLPDAIAGIDAAIAAGFPTKINCVLMRDAITGATGWSTSQRNAIFCSGSLS